MSSITDRYNLTFKQTVETTVSDDGVIAQALESPMRETIRTIIDTKEKHVHDALVMLGWKPPKKNGR